MRLAEHFISFVNEFNKFNKNTNVRFYLSYGIKITLKSHFWRKNVVILLLYTTLVNVYVDLVVFTRIAGTLKTGRGRFWR